MRFLVLALVACSASKPPAAPAVATSAPPPSAPEPAAPPRGVCHDEAAHAGRAAGDAHGSLDTNFIRHTIQGELVVFDLDELGRWLQARDQLSRCYDEYLTHGSETGRVNSVFKIEHDGHVSFAQVTGFDDGLAACVCRVVARFAFPSIVKQGSVLVNFPFTFGTSDS
ncbi:MAG TPA: hypothetical protein VM513_20460 [Kofleriaceae bacterium]|jgi:hypothetical protein|nr:hypothetical protein [Kofleriaceae bacterium]